MISCYLYPLCIVLVYETSVINEGVIEGRWLQEWMGAALVVRGSRIVNFSSLFGWSFSNMLTSEEVKALLTS